LAILWIGGLGGFVIGELKALLDPGLIGAKVIRKTRTRKTRKNQKKPEKTRKTRDGGDVPRFLGI